MAVLTDDKRKDLDEAWDNAVRLIPEYGMVLRKRELKRPSAQLEAEIKQMLDNKRKNYKPPCLSG